MTVVCDISVSLDGFVTGPNDRREEPFGDGGGVLHDWLSNGATDADRALLEDAASRTGAVVMGRVGFEKNEGDGGWGDGGPFGDTPCFVVTHRAPDRDYPPVWTFVTDGVASALEKARAAAGDKVVHLHGATIMQQGLALGLVGELRLHVVAVLLGGGTPLFGSLDSAIALDCMDVQVAPSATHLTYRVRH